MYVREDRPGVTSRVLVAVRRDAEAGAVFLKALHRELADTPLLAYYQLFMVTPPGGPTYIWLEDKDGAE